MPYPSLSLALAALLAASGCTDAHRGGLVRVSVNESEVVVENVAADTVRYEVWDASTYGIFDPDYPEEPESATVCGDSEFTLAPGERVVLDRWSPDSFRVEAHVLDRSAPDCGLSTQEAFYVGP